MAEGYWHRQFETFWSYLWRVRKHQVVLLTVGLSMTALGAAGALRVVFEFTDGDRSGSAAVDLGASPGGAWDGAMIIVGLLLAAAGGWVIVSDYFYNRRLAERHRAIVIWFRGLRNVRGEDPSVAVPEDVLGQRTLIDVDIRDYVAESRVADPVSALAKVTATIPSSIKALTSGVSSSDRTVVFAGLGSVPFTVLIGMLLGNQDRTLVLDWDRQAERWRQADTPDDGEAFHVQMPDGPPPMDVVLVGALSYPVDLAKVAHAFPNVPIHQVERSEVHVHNHWSGAKQMRLAETIRSHCANLEARGVTRIHMVLSCQSSVAFNIGRAYDWRNLPELLVYEFQRDAEPSYPWAIRMPTGGRETAEIAGDVRQLHSANGT